MDSNFFYASRTPGSTQAWVLFSVWEPVMPPQSKRQRQQHEAAAKGVAVRKEQTYFPQVTVEGEQFGGPDLGNDNGNLFQLKRTYMIRKLTVRNLAGHYANEESDNAIGEDLSDVDDDVKIGQPVIGWQNAENALNRQGHLLLDQDGRTAQQRWYYQQKNKKKMEEAEQLKRTFGTIRRFFSSPQLNSTSLDLDLDLDRASAGAIDSSHLGICSASVGEGGPRGGLAYGVQTIGASSSYGIETEEKELPGGPEEVCWKIRASDTIHKKKKKTVIGLIFDRPLVREHGLPQAIWQQASRN